MIRKGEVAKAIVTASLDSVQKSETLLVDPGAPVELILERDGTRVDGGRVIVELGVPFALTVRGRDGYGNPVSTASMSRALLGLVDEIQRGTAAPQGAPRRGR
ncbi:MAG: hypothetical protein ACREMM_03225 [Gemmatimonadales bacterium]